VLDLTFYMPILTHRKLGLYTDSSLKRYFYFEACLELSVDIEGKGKSRIGFPIMGQPIFDIMKGGISMFTQQSQQGSAVSCKELAYITDCLKNEELLAKLAVQSAADSQTPQLKHVLSQIAQDRLHHTDQLLRTLQQQAQWTH
jgi:hypothetical protein